MTTKASLLSSLKSRFGSLVSSVQEEIATRRTRITTNQKKEHEVRLAPLPREEVRTTRIPATVAEYGQIWIREGGWSVVLGDRGLAKPNLEGSVSLPWSWRESLPWGALCAADPAAAQKILEGILDAAAAAGVYTPGLTSHERPAVLKRLAREREELEREEISAIDEAAAAGVEIPHRPEVLEQRARERRAAERAQGLAEIERKSRANLDARARARRPRRQFSISSYLSSGSRVQQ